MPGTCSVLHSFLLFLLYSFQRVLKLGHTVYQEAYDDTEEGVFWGIKLYWGVERKG